MVRAKTRTEIMLNTVERYQNQLKNYIFSGEDLDDFQIIDVLKEIFGEGECNFFTDRANPYKKAELCLEFTGTPGQVSAAKRLLKEYNVSYSSGQDFVMLTLVWGFNGCGYGFRLEKNLY